MLHGCRSRSAEVSRLGLTLVQRLGWGAGVKGASLCMLFLAATIYYHLSVNTGCCYRSGAAAQPAIRASRPKTLLHAGERGGVDQSMSCRKTTKWLLTAGGKEW